jgi:diamine N-acetyltransferase
MQVTLQPITLDNWIQCIELAPTEEQARIGFVSPNVLSLAQAHMEPWWQPTAIYAGETMVGFEMHGRWPARGVPAYHEAVDPGIDHILRMMIDGRFQGRGYGRQAMTLVIVHIAAQPDARAIGLSYDPENTAAMRLFTSLGFQPTGRLVDGEIEARLSF